MVFDIVSGYVPPGTYVQELINPSGANINALAFTTTLIGTADRNKSVTNEAILRAGTSAESISPASVSPHTVTLAARSNRQVGTTAVHRIINGISSVLPPGLIAFTPAVVTGIQAGPFNLTMTNAIALEMDGIEPVTIALYPRTTAVASPLTGGVSVTTFVGPFRTPSGTVTLTATTAGATITGSPASLTVTGTDTSGAPQSVVFTTTIATGSGTVSQTSPPVSWGSITSAVLSAAITAGTISLGTTTDVTSISGRQISVGTALTSAGTAASRSDVATAINLGLANASSLGFGSAYSAVAQSPGSTITITSPLTQSQSAFATPVGLSASDSRVFAAPAQSATNTIFGSAFLNATSILQVADAGWSNIATWTVDYVENVDSILYPSAATVTDYVDSLANSNVESLNKVGTFAGAGNFVSGRDYQLAGNTISWAILTSASLTGLAGTYDLSGGSTFQIAMDGGSLITADVIGLTAATAPLGYTLGLTSPVSTANALANINAILAEELGPRYAGVASSVSGVLTLTSPSQGFASSIMIVPVSGSTAAQKLFGLTATLTQLGRGYIPAAGSLYYASYTFIRPDSDYNTPFLFFDPSAARDQVGQVSATVFNYNPLAKAVEIAFKNGAPKVYIIQINDSTTPGSPTRNEVDTALQAAEMKDEMTEIVILDQPGTNVAIQTDLLNHVEIECSPLEKHYRRGFYGMANNTAIGDVQTPGSYVYTATQVLQTAPSSPGRGRAFLMIPPQQAGVSWDFGLDDGSTARLQLDSTYLGAAMSACRSGLGSPADTLTRRTLNGFNVDDIVSPWRQQEIALLAGNGCCVVSLDGGQLKFLDPLTTEAGGGGLLEFKQDSSSYQKDNVTRKITTALTDNIVGIVPFDLANFIIDIKLIIAGVLAGEVSAGSIGPFRGPDGAVRAIDPRTDISVAQSTTDATKYFFTYYFYLRYPALRLFGQFSVDAPNFSANS